MAFNEEKRLSRGIATGLPFMALIISHLGGKLIADDRIAGDYSKGTNIIIIIPASIRRIDSSLRVFLSRNLLDSVGNHLADSFGLHKLLGVCGHDSLNRAEPLE